MWPWRKRRSLQQRGLGGAAAHGALVTMSGQAGRVLVQLLGVVVLARLLDPEDYGLVTMVAAIVGVGEVFRDFGLSSAAIQAKTLSLAQRSNLFWINVAIGIALGFVVLALSPVIAAFYGEPRLQGVAALMSMSFVFNGISTQYRAGLTRDLRFSALATIEVVAATFALGVGIYLAMSGAGYWALVIQQVSLAFLLMVLFLVSGAWLPRAPTRGAGTKPLLNFGWNVVAVNLLGYASRNVDSLVIGQRFGASSLGFYDRAFQLLAIPLNQINAPATRVALPVLSRLQNDSERFAAFLLRGQSILVHLVVSFFAFACAYAYPIVEVVLGAQWSPAVPLFQILAIGGAFQVVAYASYWVFVSLGLTKSNLLFALATRPIIIAFVLVGSIWGVTGVAWGYAVGVALLWPAGLFWLSRVSQAPVGVMFTSGIRALVGYAISALAACGPLLWFDIPNPIARLGIGLGAFIIAAALVSLLWRKFRGDQLAVFGVLKLIKRKPQQDS